jgi:hypothetical protein
MSQMYGNYLLDAGCRDDFETLRTLHHAAVDRKNLPRNEKLRSLDDAPLSLGAYATLVTYTGRAVDSSR